MTDFRAKISPKPAGVNTILGPNESTNILQPLHRTNGVIFPYTPVVQVQGSAAYNQYEFVHSIYSQNTYRNTPSPTINVSGVFTAQNTNEARYLLSVLHFFKVVTKSFFGAKDLENAGVPPPVLEFTYLGDFMFKRLPVVVKSYSYTLPNEVDYVPVDFTISRGQEGQTFVPVQMEIFVEIAPQFIPSRLKNQFSLEEFTTGKYLGETNIGFF